MPSSLLSISLKGDKELERKLNSLAKARNATAHIYNHAVDYGPGVQSREHMYGVHRGYWDNNTDDAVTKRLKPWILSDLKKAAAKAFAPGGVRGNWLKPWAGRVARRVENAMREYAPERAGSTYVRTYRLRRGWRSRVID